MYFVLFFCVWFPSCGRDAGWTLLLWKSGHSGAEYKSFISLCHLHSLLHSPPTLFSHTLPNVSPTIPTPPRPPLSLLGPTLAHPFPRTLFPTKPPSPASAQPNPANANTPTARANPRCRPTKRSRTFCAIHTTCRGQCAHVESETQRGRVETRRRWIASGSRCDVRRPWWKRSGAEGVASGVRWAWGGGEAEGGREGRGSGWYVVSSVEAWVDIDLRSTPLASGISAQTSQVCADRQ